MANHLHPAFHKLVQRSEKELHLNQRSKVIWLTGLSGAGKSTIAVGLEKILFENGFFAQVLDGDNIRQGINKNLGFSLDDRAENIRRISEVSKLYLNSGIITISSFISPTNEIREMASDIIGSDDFIEIFINAPLEVCEKRDVKGLYKKARNGEIMGFTGIDSPYEPPQNPELIIHTDQQTEAASIQKLFNFILPMITLK